MPLDSTDPIANPAFDAFAEGVRRPWNDMDTLIDLARVLYRYDDFHALVRSFEDDPAVVRLLIERPDVGVDFDALADSPVGSLGAALHARHGDDPFVCFDFGGSPVHTYLVCHLLETAPLWNTVLDTDPEDDTRLLQLAFVAAQVPTAPVLAFLARNLSKVGLERFDRHDAAMGSLVQGWTLGRRARSLLGADWPALTRRPLEEVRADFGITAADAAKNRRCSSALRAGDPVLMDDVDTEAFLEAMGRIVLLPYGGTGFETGAALREALVNPPRVGEFAKQMFSQEALAARGQERPRLGDLDLASLHELPEGSLGRIFGDHMALKEFEPPPAVPENESDFARYFTAHIIETHDLWHVVTGARTDKAGECALHSFYTGQLSPLPVQLAYVARCILKTAIWDMDLATRHLDGVARGWILARRVAPLALVDWRSEFDRPLEAVRARFEVPAEGIDAVPLDTGDLV
ncbi:MAG: Coq4 family protein [Myxococcota bacterium]